MLGAQGLAAKCSRAAADFAGDLRASYRPARSRESFYIDRLFRLSDTNQIKRLKSERTSQRQWIHKPADAQSHRPALDSAVSTRQPVVDYLSRRSAIMSKPTKTEAELIAMASEELKVHLDCPDGIAISVLRDGDSWEFRTTAGEATIARPGYPECVAMIVQIGDHLSKQFDVSG
jgi:hypothetical protein